MEKLTARIKHLQKLKDKNINLEWSTEIVKTFLYYRKIDKAQTFLHHSAYTDKSLDFLIYYVETFDKILKKSFNFEEFKQNEHVFKHFKLFMCLLEHFGFRAEILKMANVDSTGEQLRIIYDITQDRDVLKKLVEEDVYITKDEYKHYAKKHGIHKRHILQIFAKTNASWAYKIAKHFNWL